MGIDLYVTLNSQKYQLDTTGDDAPYKCYDQSQYPAETQDQFWLPWESKSWHQGERLKRILKEEELELAAYHDAEGVDVSEWGELKLQTSLTRTYEVQSATLPMVVTNDGSTLIGGFTSSNYIRTSTDATTWTGRTTVSAHAVTDLCVGTGQNIFAVQNGVLIESTNNGASWASTSKTGAPTTIVGVTWCADQLFVLTPTHLKYWDGAAWQDAATWGGDVVATYKEDVYWAEDNLLFRWNGMASFQADRLPTGFSITGLFDYGGLLFITGYFSLQGGKTGAVYYLYDTRRAHLFSIDSTDGSANYTINAVAGGIDEVFFANAKRGGADRYDLTYGGLSCGPAWGGAGQIPFKGLAYWNGKLAIARYDNAAATDGVYVANLAIPSAYKTTGWLTTAAYNFGWPNDSKIIKDITVEHSALATGQSVKVEYSTNYGTSWTTAGTSNTAASTSASYSLTSVSARDLKLKLTLAGGGSNTPTVRRVFAQGAPVVDDKQMWHLRVFIAAAKGGRSKVAALHTAKALQSTMSFIDLYGTSHNVIVQRVLEEPFLGSANTMVATITLREV